MISRISLLNHKKDEINNDYDESIDENGGEEYGDDQCG
jgi:hypothetical protein